MYVNSRDKWRDVKKQWVSHKSSSVGEIPDVGGKVMGQAQLWRQLNKPSWLVGTGKCLSRNTATGLTLCLRTPPDAPMGEEFTFFRRKKSHLLWVFVFILLLSLHPKSEFCRKGKREVAMGALAPICLCPPYRTFLFFILKYKI